MRTRTWRWLLISNKDTNCAGDRPRLAQIYISNSHLESVVLATRSTMGVFKASLIIAGMAAVPAYIAMLTSLLGVGRIVWDHQPGECHVLEGIEYGSEDVEVLADDIALITSGLKFSIKMQRENPAYIKGQIFWFDFKSPSKPPVPVKIEGNFDLENFNPHGMSSWRDRERGVTSIYVVNHQIDKDQSIVEKFTWEGNLKVLTHVRSISDPAFRLINDLILVGDDKFYITNTMYYRHDLGRLLQVLTFRKWGDVIYFDGHHGKVVADGLQGPNGVAVSLDGKFLYVATFLSGNLNVYSRQSDNSLETKNVIPIGGGLDNIQVDPGNGDLWIGAHPIIWKLLPHDADIKQPAPSQVLRLKMKGTEADQIEEVFADSGRHIYGSAVAAYRRGGVLIGTIMHKAMYCQVTYLQ